MAVFPGAVATNSDLYVAVNNLSCLLTDNPLTIGATTVNVNTTTGFPAVGTISIDAEIIHYTGITATSFTGCTRGFDGTSAASHSVGAQVDHNVVAAHHNVLKDETIAVESFIQTHIGLTTNVLAAEFEFLDGVTSNLQTQLNAKAPLASPTFTGVVTIPTPFTLGATSVTTTGAELNFVAGVTSAIQTQLNAKATDSLVVHLAGTETITGIKTYTGNLFVNAVTARVIDGDTPQTQIEALTANEGGFSIIRNNTTASSGGIFFGKTRGTSLGATTIVANNDTLGKLVFCGSDGTNLIPAAQITVSVDATPGSGDMPGRITFNTTADGAAAVTERMRIDRNGSVGIGTPNPELYNTNARNLVIANSAGAVGMTLRCNTNSSNVIGFTDAEGTTLQGLIQYTHNATAASETIILRIGGADLIVFTGNGHFLPGGTTGTQNIGDAVTYWGDVSYKTLTDRGCLPWCDDGVELCDGSRVSDLDALCSIEKHPTELTVHGLPKLDYRTFPKKAYRPADKDGELLLRDENDRPYFLDELGNRKDAADGVEMTMIFGVMIGAFKQLKAELDAAKARITELEAV